MPKLKLSIDDFKSKYNLSQEAIDYILKTSKYITIYRPELYNNCHIKFKCEYNNFIQTNIW